MPKNRLIPKTNTASVSAKSAIMFNGVIFALGGKIIVSVGPELIGLLADEEIISVLSHEMAHYKKNHWIDLFAEISSDFDRTGTPAAPDPGN